LEYVFRGQDHKNQWEELDTPVVGGSAASFAELIRVDALRLGKLVRDAGVTLE